MDGRIGFGVSEGDEPSKKIEQVPTTIINEFERLDKRGDCSKRGQHLDSQ